MKRVVARLSAVLVVVLVASMLLTGLASAEPAKRKIVVFDATVVNEAAKENLIRTSGGEPIKTLPLINGYAVYLPAQAEKALRERPGVVRIDDDLVGQALAKPGGGNGGPPQPAVQTVGWGVNRISAPSAWAYSKGAGVKVAVIDSGIATGHPDLKVWGGVNTIKGTKINDDLGHGSHVAGIIAALNNSTGVVGVAPEARLYAVKALNAAGLAYQSDVIEGLYWAINNTEYGRMDVVNMSLGWSSGNQSFHDAIIRTVSSGIVVVAAAGNSGSSSDGTTTVMFPAQYPEVIAVSASNQSDGIASFSSRGPEVDLIAPGESILSTYKGSGYATMSGTSMAAPHVAGVVALRIAKNRAQGLPDETPGQIADALYSTADSLGLAPELQGAGLVNAYDVVAP